MTALVTTLTHPALPQAAARIRPALAPAVAFVGVGVAALLLVVALTVLAALFRRQGAARRISGKGA